MSCIVVVAGSICAEVKEKKREKEAAELPYRIMHDPMDSSSTPPTGHDSAVWQSLLHAARERATAHRS